jgi:hypothetical protein
METQNCTMKEFIEIVIESTPKQSTGQSLFKSLGMSLLSNALTLPFGYVSASVSRSKSPTEMREQFSNALYGPFKVGFFSNDEDKIEAKENLELAERYLDYIPVDKKIIFLKAALQESSEYLEVMKKILNTIKSQKAA